MGYYISFLGGIQNQSIQQNLPLRPSCLSSPHKFFLMSASCLFTNWHAAILGLRSFWPLNLSLPEQTKKDGHFSFNFNLLQEKKRNSPSSRLFRVQTTLNQPSWKKCASQIGSFSPRLGVKTPSHQLLWMVQKSQTTTWDVLNPENNGISRISYHINWWSPDFSHQQ